MNLDGVEVRVHSGDCGVMSDDACTCNAQPVPATVETFDGEPGETEWRVECPTGHGLWVTAERMSEIADTPCPRCGKPFMVSEREPDAGRVRWGAGVLHGVGRDVDDAR